MSRDIHQMTTDVVTSYLSQNDVAGTDLSILIQTVANALQDVAQIVPQPAPVLQPAVPIKRSISNDRIICLECGVTLKTLRNHLRSAHGLTDHEYRGKWRLPADYPMVARDSAEVRSRIAKASGLGTRRRRPII